MLANGPGDDIGHGGTGMPPATLAESATANATTQTPGAAQSNAKQTKGRGKRGKPASPTQQPLATASGLQSPTQAPQSPVAPATSSSSSLANLSTCDTCGLEFYITPPFQPSSWLRIVYEALKKLHEEGSPHRKYFHYKHDICGYIDKHWSDICPEKKRTLTWNNTVSAVITTHRKLFKSNRKQSGFWTLRSQSGTKGSGSSDEEDQHDEEAVDQTGEGRRKTKKTADKKSKSKKRGISEITPKPSSAVADDMLDNTSSVSSSTTSAADSPTLTSPGPTSDDESWGPTTTTHTPPPTGVTVNPAKRRKTAEVPSTLPLQQPPPPHSSTANTRRAVASRAMHDPEHLPAATLTHHEIPISRAHASHPTTNPALLLNTQPAHIPALPLASAPAYPPIYTAPTAPEPTTNQGTDVWDDDQHWGANGEWHGGHAAWENLID